MRRPIVFFLAIAILLMGAIVSLPDLHSAARTNTPPDSSGGFVGAWRVTLPAGRPALGTFTSDGLFLPTAFVVHSAPPGAAYHSAFLSTGTGTWRATGPRSADVTGFVLESNELADYVGTFRIQASLTLAADGQTFDGRYAFDVTAPDGRVLEAGTGAVHGARIAVAPLGTPTAGTGG